MIRPVMLALACASVVIAGPAFAEPVTLRVGDPLPRADRITPSVHRYLIYVVKDGRREAVDIWTRTLSRETLDGQDIIRVAQRWDRAAPPAVRLQDSTFEASTFRPLDHLDTMRVDGVETLRGYRFEGDRIVGIADLPSNSRADFVQPASEPPYNFETDIEQFQGLDWSPGYEVSIPFYDPGRAEPARYVFRTVGSATIAGPAGAPLDCWVVTGDYSGAGSKTFWIAKDTQVVVREESRAEGAVYIKTLLSAESADEQ